VTVVVPTSDLPKGFIIDETVVAARDIAADLVYQDAITIDDFDAINGLPLLRPVQKGRPLMRQDVIDDSPKDFSHLLTKGMRAITIEIDEINSIAQMLKPGNFIDLHLIANEPDETQSQEVFPFLQHVKVIATGQTTVESVSRPVNRNPELEGIMLAQQTGRIRATLRPHDDMELASYGAVTTRSLLGSAKKGGGAAPATVKVEYIVGGKAGAGAAPPININMPAMPGLTPEAFVPGSLPPGVTAVGGSALQNAVDQANPAAYAQQ
jgi:pilus assembly protein CpaB